MFGNRKSDVPQPPVAPSSAATPTPDERADEHLHEGAVGEDDEEHYVPAGSAQPLAGRAPAPVVKRFNRRTVAVIVTLLAFAALAAFAKALLNRPRALTNQDSAAQRTAAVATANDAVNALPGSYGEVKRPPPALGPPLPGDVGAMATGTVVGQAPGAIVPGGARPAQGPPQLSPYEQYLQQLEMERLKRQDKAKEAGFSFAGAEGGAGGGQSTSPAIAALQQQQQDALARLQQLSGGGGAGAGAAGALPASLLGGGGFPQQPSPRDDGNRQDDKARFLEQDRGGSNRFYLKEVQRAPRSPYTLFGGTIIPGVLITGMNSDLPGQIKGQISQNVYDTVTGQHLLLPQGTTIIGTYDSRVTYGQSRVLVVWTRLIRPDGSNIDLEGMPGTDLSGYAGITGDVDRHIWRLLGAVVLGSVIQAGVKSGGQSYGAFGPQSFSDASRQGIGEGVSNATNQVVRRELQVQPTIKVPPGERFNVFTTKDIVLTPYGR